MEIIRLKRKTIQEMFWKRKANNDAYNHIQPRAFGENLYLGALREVQTLEQT
jgi:hypothetical protein